MTAAEASPIWMAGNPDVGEWHLYTGGWVTTVVARGEAGDFDFVYTPRGMAQPVWQTLDPDPEFNGIADRLNRRDLKRWKNGKS